MADAEEDEFEYHVHIRAKEAFINAIRNKGVSLPQSEAEDLTFIADKQLDMRALKRSGIVWSYVVARIRKTKEIIDQG